MDQSTHGEHLSQPLQTNNKQFKIADTCFTGYNCIFNFTNKNNNFYFTKITNDDGFSVISVLLGAYKLERLNDESKRIIIKEGFFKEDNYPFIIKPNL